MSRRVPLRVPNGLAKPSRGDVFAKVYGSLNIALTRLIDVENGYIALCQNDCDVDGLLSDKAAAELRGINLEARTPPHIAAQRSVICRRVDPWVGEHTDIELKNEFERVHPWVKIVEVIKFGTHTHVFKVVFRETKMAVKATEEGLLAFSVKLSPDQISREEFIDILMCFSCYKLDDHISKNCPSRDTVICSECSAIGHKWNHCTSSVKRCINCRGNHRTMSMACPTKREIIANKKTENKNKESENTNKTYSDVAKEVLRQKNETQTMLHVENNTPLDVLVCIMHAHVINIAVPGSFATELNSMLKANGIKEMKFPDNPPSGKLLNITNLMKKPEPAPPRENLDAGEKGTRRKSDEQLKKLWERRLERDGEMETDSDVDSLGAVGGVCREASTVQSIVKNLESVKQSSTEGTQSEIYQKDGTNVEQYDAKDIGLHFFASERHGFPKKKEIKLLVEGLKFGHYKYEYEANISEKDFLRDLEMGKIKVTKECCVVVPITIFNKKRSGPMRSPAQRDPRSRSSSRSTRKPEDPGKQWSLN